MQRHLFLLILFLCADPILCLTQSDGYNIGVILGSIIAALVAIAIGGFIFYACCVKNWLYPNEPKELGYKRQEDIFGVKKSKPRPTTGSGRGTYNLRGATSVVPKDTERRDRYKTEYQPDDYGRGASARQQTYTEDRTGMVSIVGPKGGPPQTTIRYEGHSEFGGGAAPAVVLTSSEGMDRGRNSSTNMTTYSSESEFRGRPSSYEAQRVYHQESTMTASRAAATSSAHRASPTPLSAAYLGTGV